MTELEEIHGILHKLNKEDFEKVRFYINKITLKAIEFEKSKVKENELLHSVSNRVCNWIALNKNTGSWVKFENLHIDQMLDKVMMFEDGNLANYEIYEHNI